MAIKEQYALWLTSDGHHNPPFSWQLAADMPNSTWYLHKLLILVGANE
jgi:hypothetical protein